MCKVNLVNKSENEEEINTTLDDAYKVGKKKGFPAFWEILFPTILYLPHMVQ